MRHRKAGKKLGINTSHRRAMFRNMVTSLFKYEQIETTSEKARQIRPIAEKIITLAKRGDLHARRQALSYLKDKSVTHQLFEETKERFLDRQGGYIRIIKKGLRKGDGAEVSVIQLITKEDKEKKGKSKKKTPASQSKTAAKKSGNKPKEQQKEEKTQLKEETQSSQEEK